LEVDVQIKTDCAHTKHLILRLLDLEVGDAIIQRYSGRMLRDALKEIGGLAEYQLDEETKVLTCVAKKSD
jgi:hypothetical protein